MDHHRVRSHHQQLRSGDGQRLLPGETFHICGRILVGVAALVDLGGGDLEANPDVDEDLSPTW
jgi:hypothetical protein